MVGLVRQIGRFHPSRLIRRLSKIWSVAIAKSGFHSYAPSPIKTSVDFVKMHFESDSLLRLKLGVKYIDDHLTQYQKLVLVGVK